MVIENDFQRSRLVILVALLVSIFVGYLVADQSRDAKEEAADPVAVSTDASPDVKNRPIETKSLSLIHI